MTGYLNVDVRHQLADLTSAVDEILALYRLGVYRRIVAADPGNQEAAKRLAELEQAVVVAESGQAAAVSGWL